MLVKLLSGRSPLLYSYQKSMPSLPVPDLDKTLERVRGHFAFNYYLKLLKLFLILFHKNTIFHCSPFGEQPSFVTQGSKCSSDPLAELINLGQVPLIGTEYHTLIFCRHSSSVSASDHLFHSAGIFFSDLYSQVQKLLP